MVGSVHTADTTTFAGVSDRLLLHHVIDVLEDPLSSEFQICSAVASISTSAKMPHHAAQALLDIAASRVKHTVKLGQVVVMSRRALHGTPDVLILKEAVCHLPEGATLLLLNESYWVSPPFRVCSGVERSQAESAGPLFVALMSSQIFSIRDAWEAACALSD
jgi:hypothetical protein